MKTEITTRSGAKVTLDNSKAILPNGNVEFVNNCNITNDKVHGMILTVGFNTKITLDAAGVGAVNAHFDQVKKELLAEYMGSIECHQDKMEARMSGKYSDN